MDASWSPDGKQIVFGRVPWLSGPDEKISIQMVDLASKRMSRIPGSENLFSPHWSPDGHHLAALTSDSKKLMLFDFMNQRWTNWVTGSDAISSPVWSRDSEYIYYDSSSNRDLGYHRIKLGGARPEPVVDLNNLRRLGYWSGLAPDGSPLFIRDSSADDICSLDLELPQQRRIQSWNIGRVQPHEKHACVMLPSKGVQLTGLTSIPIRLSPSHGLLSPQIADLLAKGAWLPVPGLKASEVIFKTEQ